MTNHFSPYEPPYTLEEKLSRLGTLLYASATVASHLVLQTQTKFAASVEITDRCNAGCHYCYVYPSEWSQQERIQGYMQLSPQEHRIKEKQVFETLERLKKQGIVHVTLVGGETALAPKAIQRASELFPVVWVVTNGAAKLPNLPRSTAVFVSIDGLPDYHNHSRDPLGFFSKTHYGNLTGMAAAIVRNINESDRGAYVHITLTRQSLQHFPDAVDWIVRDIKKLRGIVVSGAATTDKADPISFQLQDRQLLKQMVAACAKKYGWQLFPFNQPKVNEFLFDEKYIINDASSCSVAKRVESLNFEGKSVGKCILRDEILCETCVCNITGLAQGINSFDVPTILGVMRATFG
ncbi:MAG: radical SAM protein [Nostoc sp.]|uniref:radical SAM protein n=1 Tax=Nostoc sp. TaxID=1180 RepID=UPI002FF5D819